jgi:hypothetical protein
MQFKRTNIQNNIILLFLFTLVIIQSSCKKFVEVEAPVTSLNTKNVYNIDATAAAVLTGLYMDLSKGRGAVLSIIPALSADELTLFGGSSSEAINYIPVYQNRLTSSNNSEADFCNFFYPKIYIVNSAIEGITSSNTLNPLVKKQLLGEAYFMRAFYYFYLVNLYGDIPLALTSDYSINSLLSKSSKAKVYDQIIDDLKKATGFLSARYLQGDALTPYQSGLEERVRPTTASAMALLARVYLFVKDWKNAEIQSSLIIENTSFFHMSNLDETFLKNNSESIWQIQSINNFTNTIDATYFLLYETGPNNSDFYLSDDVINSFEQGDQRKVKWVNKVTVSGNTYYYPYKYKLDVGSPQINEYTILLRLAEQYLIRAEARSEQDNLIGAGEDLNVIRRRAGLDATKANTKIDLLAAILKERRIEFFTECGHRWLDLKRAGKIDEVMSKYAPRKQGIWNSNMAWYPFSLTDLLNDPNLTQNSGYQ